MVLAWLSDMLRPVGRPRVAHEIVSQLRELILNGSFAVGDKIPPERELAERLGVNRGSLREAIKSLELIGLVRTRQGDGTRVTDFMRTAGIELVSHLLLRGGEAPDLALLGEVLEFRVSFGRECARLAATRATPEQLARLREVAARNDAPDVDAVTMLRNDFDFYVELAAAAKNRVLLLLLNTIRGAVETYAPFFAGFKAPAAVIRLHEGELFAALEAKAAKGAEHLASEYPRAAASSNCALAGVTSAHALRRRDRSSASTSRPSRRGRSLRPSFCGRKEAELPGRRELPRSLLLPDGLGLEHTLRERFDARFREPRARLVFDASRERVVAILVLGAIVVRHRAEAGGHRHERVATDEAVGADVARRAQRPVDAVELECHGRDPDPRPRLAIVEGL